MELRRIILAICFAAIGASPLLAQLQVHDIQTVVSEIVESIAASSEEDVNVEAHTDDLLFLSENPLNINSATADELGRLIFLTDFQIASLLKYVKTSGEFKTIYELQLVIGFDFEDIRRLLPFVVVTPSNLKPTSKSLFKYGKHDLFLRARTSVETADGFRPPPKDNPNATRYAGSKLGLYTRYSYSTRGGLQLGFVGENDPGEDLFQGSNPYGFDHYSGHIQLTNRGVVKSMVVGDFNAEFGQGLTLWTSTAFGKTNNPMGLRKRARGIYRSSSTNENQFLRGVGTTLNFGRLELSAFGSYKWIDANISDTLNDGTLIFSSRPTSGLHRTPSEIRNKKSLSEVVAGGNANLSFESLKLGVSCALANQGGLPEVTSQPYQLFLPPHTNRTNLGTDFSWALKNHLLFGEAAWTVGHGSGAVGGALFRIHTQLTFSAVGRYYQKDYSTDYTGAIADGSSAANESGVLAGFQFQPYKHWKVAGYVDVFQSTWLKFGVSAPSRGHDYLMEATYSPSTRLSLVTRYKFKQKEKNVTADDYPTRWVLPYAQQSLRLHLGYNPSREIQLKSRVEFAWYTEEGKNAEVGIMVYQDISYRPTQIPLTVTARLAVFDTDSWNARIYAYENDVLYYFSIPAYSSQGTRAFFLVKYSIGKSMDLWFRVSQTFFTNTKELGSGLDRIDGSTRSDARLQVRIQF